jgi:hypothetical protein
MLATVGSRELVEWFAFLELEANAVQEMRDELEAEADTGPSTLGANPNDPLGIAGNGLTLGG